MASKKKASKKAADPDTLRHITLKNIGDGALKVYGVAKKAIVKDTMFGAAHGLKGTFEAMNGDNRILKSKRAFLGPDAQSAIAAKLAGTDSVRFGVTITKDGDAVTAKFFVEPGPADMLGSLRESAESA